MDKKGQLSLEYLLLFFISLLLLSIISIPLLNSSIEDTMDMTDAVKVKSSLTEISGNVKLIYSLGDESKKVVSIYLPRDLYLYCNNEDGRYYLSTTLNLSDNSHKTIKVEIPCNVTFNGNPSHRYTHKNSGWYYNSEFRWVVSSDGTRSVNINFR